MRPWEISATERPGTEGDIPPPKSRGRTDHGPAVGVGIGGVEKACLPESLSSEGERAGLGAREEQRQDGNEGKEGSKSKEKSKRGRAEYIPARAAPRSTAPFGVLLADSTGGGRVGSASTMGSACSRVVRGGAAGAPRQQAQVVVLLVLEARPVGIPVLMAMPFASPSTSSAAPWSAFYSTTHSLPRGSSCRVLLDS